MRERTHASALPPEEPWDFWGPPWPPWHRPILSDQVEMSVSSTLSQEPNVRSLGDITHSHLCSSQHYVAKSVYKD